jgi:hypothetical protein
MEESPVDRTILVCPNCGFEHMESCEENFVREIYQNSLRPDKDELMETIEYWNKDREYLLSGEREEHMQ